MEVEVEEQAGEAGEMVEEAAEELVVEVEEQAGEPNKRGGHSYRQTPPQTVRWEQHES